MKRTIFLLNEKVIAETDFFIPGKDEIVIIEQKKYVRREFQSVHYSVDMKAAFVNLKSYATKI